MKKHYMAIDQYGNTFHSLLHPRKDLCMKIGCSHVSKMFVDTKDGNARHTGYVISGHWLSVYEVKPINSDN